MRNTWGNALKYLAQASEGDNAFISTQEDFYFVIIIFKQVWVLVYNSDAKNIILGIFYFYLKV